MVTLTEKAKREANEKAVSLFTKRLVEILLAQVEYDHTKEDDALRANTSA